MIAGRGHVRNLTGDRCDLIHEEIPNGLDFHLSSCARIGDVSNMNDVIRSDVLLTIEILDDRFRHFETQGHDRSHIAVDVNDLSLLTIGSRHRFKIPQFVGETVSNRRVVRLDKTEFVTILSARLETSDVNEVDPVVPIVHVVGRRVADGDAPLIAKLDHRTKIRRWTRTCDEGNEHFGREIVRVGEMDLFRFQRIQRRGGNRVRRPVEPIDRPFQIDERQIIARRVAIVPFDDLTKNIFLHSNRFRSEERRWSLIFLVEPIEKEENLIGENSSIAVRVDQIKISLKIRRLSERNDGQKNNRQNEEHSQNENEGPL